MTAEIRQSTDATTPLVMEAPLGMPVLGSTKPMKPGSWWSLADSAATMLTPRDQETMLPKRVMRKTMLTMTKMGEVSPTMTARASVMPESTVRSSTGMATPMPKAEIR